MGNIEHCEHGVHWSGHCPACATEPLTDRRLDVVPLDAANEIRSLRQQLEGAVEALQRIARAHSLSGHIAREALAAMGVDPSPTGGQCADHPKVTARVSGRCAHPDHGGQ